MLETRGLCAFYGDFQALFGIDVRLAAREIIAVIGANGAGKSTFLHCVTGLLSAEPRAVCFDGEAIGGMPADRIVRRGIALVPEGRRLFPSLSVEENLSIGAYGGRGGPWTLDCVYELFPRLRVLRRKPAPLLSGGEQQMVAIGRALLANPRLLLCDEISLGLAPIIIDDLYKILPKITAEGTAVLVVEQDISRALAVADRVYCFREGIVSLEGRPTEITHSQITAAYFGT
jgi:branched-chain amino acid transport system ATP-binding protein